MLRPLNRLVPSLCVTLTLAEAIDESCRLTPTFIITRFGMTRSPASTYVLAGRICWSAPPAIGFG